MKFFRAPAYWAVFGGIGPFFRSPRPAREQEPGLSAGRRERGYVCKIRAALITRALRGGRLPPRSHNINAENELFVCSTCGTLGSWPSHSHLASPASRPSPAVGS